MNFKPIIIIPFTLPWNHSADYQKQTVLELERRGYTVIAYMAEEAKFFLKTAQKSEVKKTTLIFHQPQFLLPLRRLEFINQLNFIIDQWRLNWRLGIYTKKIIWIFDPQFEKFADNFSAKVTLYDCVDFHTATNSKIARRLRQQENSLIKKVDYFFVNSHALKLLHQNLRKPALVPQGVKTTLLNHRRITPPKKNPKPIIGYIGGINYRFDFELLQQVITRHPEWEFEFWGPEQTDEQDQKIQTKLKLKQLKKLSNTHWRLAKNVDELARAIQRFDVCLIPYNSQQLFNYYSFPMKLFEYFMFGKPVVSTKILELTRPPYNHFVGCYDDRNEFAVAINKVLAKPWPIITQKAQLKLAQKHAWTIKIGKILATLGQPLR